MNTSRPRTFSSSSTVDSPSLKRLTASATERHHQVTRDVLGELRIGVAREHRHRRTIHQNSDESDW